MRTAVGACAARLRVGRTNPTKTWCLTSTETIRLIRDGELGRRGHGDGGRGRLYTHHYTVTTRMIPALKMGSDESHFNVSVGNDGQNHKTASTNHNLFEEKGEPKRYRTEVLSLTSLTPYR